MTDYEQLALEVAAASSEVRKEMSILANASALIYEAMDDLNWCGFYLADGEVLYLGPFQGKVACTEILFGSGVCGTAAVRNATVLVYDVHQFSGHIACDSASNSEIVVPLFRGGRLFGVLDIDSPFIGRFTEEDKKGLERVALEIEKALEKFL